MLSFPSTKSSLILYDINLQHISCLPWLCSLGLEAAKEPELTSRASSKNPPLKGHAWTLVQSQPWQNHNEVMTALWKSLHHWLHSGLSKAKGSCPGKPHPVEAATLPCRILKCPFLINLANQQTAKKQAFAFFCSVCWHQRDKRGERYHHQYDSPDSEFLTLC